MERFKNATLVIAVLGLLVVGWSSPASAHCKPNGPHVLHCGTSVSIVAFVDIEYVGWGGPTGDLHVQIRVTVLDEAMDPVEANVEIHVLVGGVDVFRETFIGTTSLGDNGLVRFNFKTAPIGCYRTTVVEVVGVEANIGMITTTHQEDFQEDSCDDS